MVSYWLNSFPVALLLRDRNIIYCHCISLQVYTFKCMSFRIRYICYNMYSTYTTTCFQLYNTIVSLLSGFRRMKRHYSYSMEYVGSVLTHAHSVDLSIHHSSVDCCVPHLLMEHSLLLAQRASVVDC